MLIRNIIIRKAMISLLLTVCLSGCWSRRELNTFAIVSGVAIDKGNESNQVQVTTQIIKVSNITGSSKAGKEGQKASSYWVVDRKGTTIFDAVQKFSQITNRKLYWSHNEVILFGQELVKSDGLNKYVDFFIRNPENRPTIWIMIAREKASRILHIPSELEKIPAYELAEIMKNQHSRSETVRVNIHNYLQKLPSKTTAQIIPLVGIETKNKEELRVVKELAVLKKDKYVGELNIKETHGLQWLLGNERTNAIVTINCPQGGGKVSMEIIQSQSKVIPKIAGNKLKIAIKISAQADITEQTCSEQFFSPKGWDLLQKSLADIIRSDVMASINKGKELNADVFAFGDSFHGKYRQKWAVYERKWDHLFPDLDVTVTTKAELRFHGLNVKPPRSG